MTKFDSLHEHILMCMEPWDPSNLKCTDKETIEFLDGIGVHNHRLPIRLSEATFELRPLIHGGYPSSWIYLEVWIGDTANDCYLSASGAQSRLEALGFQQNLAELSSSSLRIVISYIFADLISSISGQIKAEIDIMDAQFSKTKLQNNCLWFDLIDGTYPFLKFGINYPTELAHKYLNAIWITPSINKPDTSLNVMLESSYRTDPSPIEKHDVENLSVGDGLLLPEDWCPMPRWVVCGSDFVFPIKKIKETFVADGPVRNQESSQDGKDKCMLDNSSNAMTEISIEVAHARMPIQDLSQIEDGKVIQCDQEITDQVKLIWNGSPVAKATLIQIDGKFAVQVTEIL